GGASLVRRRVDDVAAVRREEAARGAALARADAAQPGAVDVHREDLIARRAVTRGLEDQLPAIEREVRLRVLATRRELPDVAQVALPRGIGPRIALRLREAGGGCGGRQRQNDECSH